MSTTAQSFEKNLMSHEGDKSVDNVVAELVQAIAITMLVVITLICNSI